ncbi:MAG: FAD-binding oxidoreductase [Spirochaetaceae bacterium]|nr:MAG: FAD-binding oxidoreductase [Spirochaetaceae bacterium]
MNRIERACSRLLRGNYRTDEQIRGRCASDMSIYTIVPAAVVQPADAGDIAALLRFCTEQQVPVTPRAGASNTGGSAIGRGIVLLPIQPADGASPPRAGAGSAAGARSDAAAVLKEHNDELLVEAAAALRHDRLQRILLERGFHLPSDPSSGPLSCIGANVATRASGAHALRHGAIDRYLESLVAVLPDGTRIDTAVADTIPARIRDGLSAIAARLRADSEAAQCIRRKQQQKSASGYNLAALLADSGPDITALFAGSAGTLGVIETVRLRCPRKPADDGLLVLSFDSEADACDAVSAVRRTDPAACEILNAYCVQLLAEQGIRFAETSGAMLVVEYSGDAPGSAAEAAHNAAGRLYGLTGARTAIAVSGAEEQAAFWKVRKSMMLRLRRRADGRSALSLVNDIGVPPQNLERFLRAVTPIFSDRDIPLPIYGHAADGNLHLRPLFDTGDPGLAATLRAVADQTYELALSLGGTITAEHGMGRLRAPYLRREWGDTLYTAMREVKRLFDPADILNSEAMFYEGDLLQFFRQQE